MVLYLANLSLLYIINKFIYHSSIKNKFLITVHISSKITKTWSVKMIVLSHEFEKEQGREYGGFGGRKRKGEIM